MSFAARVPGEGSGAEYSDAMLVRSVKSRSFPLEEA